MDLPNDINHCLGTKCPYQLKKFCLRWVENNKKGIVWVSDFTPQKQGNKQWNCEEKIEKKEV